MGYGDEILAAGQAQRLYDADPSTRIAIVEQTGRPRWHDIWHGNPIIAPPADVAAGERVRLVINGPGCRPYITYPFDEQIGWTFNQAFKCREHIARIYLTIDERQRGKSARARYGSYVLIEPYTKHGNFRWPLIHWIELVEACSPEITFVQHLHRDSPIVSGAHGEYATFREACGLVASADIYVRSESGMCHAAAALGAKQVTIFGGCMDAEVMGGYPGQACIVDCGQGSPCGRWLPCQHCAEAMARITVDEVAAALRERLRERKVA